MRRRICEATAASLAASGFHGTSVAQVVQAAAISQGALLHHYPAKEDLVAATASFLLERSVKWFARAKESLVRHKGGFAEVIRKSWREQFQSDDYAALLEILVAARTDEGLRARLDPALRDWRRQVDIELAELLPGDLKRKQLEAVLTISRCLMTGLVVHDSLLGDRARMEGVIDSWLALLDAVAA